MNVSEITHEINKQRHKHKQQTHELHWMDKLTNQQINAHMSEQMNEQQIHKPINKQLHVITRLIT